MWTALVYATDDLVSNIIWVALHQVVQVVECRCVWLIREYVFIAIMMNFCTTVNSLRFGFSISLLLILGTSESAVCVWIESWIESGIKIRIESFQLNEYY